MESKASIYHSLYIYMHIDNSNVQNVLSFHLQSCLITPTMWTIVKQGATIAIKSQIAALNHQHPWHLMKHSDPSWQELEGWYLSQGSIERITAVAVTGTYTLL